jgi:long-chain acyl-CoA synthetase
MSTKEEIIYILNDCMPEVIFVSQEKKELLHQALIHTRYKPHVIVIDEYEQGEPDVDVTSLNVIPHSEEQTAVIIYTSGTTGKPKGVMLSYKNILTNIYAVTCDVEIFKPTDVILMLLPLHHIFPLVGTMILPLYSGAKIAISRTLASEEILKVMNDNQVSILLGVPRLFTAIHKGIKDKITKDKLASAMFKVASIIQKKKISRFIFRSVHKKFGGHIRFLVTGGAALDVSVGQFFKTLGFDVLEGYGMTESSPMITFTHPDKIRLGSTGLPVANCQVKIKEGEIIAKGPNVMQGYYNNPEATAEVIREGWLHTGDIGYFNEDGFLFITGRKKEIIVLSNGKNINPKKWGYINQGIS